MFTGFTSQFTNDIQVQHYWLKWQRLQREEAEKIKDRHPETLEKLDEE